MEKSNRLVELYHYLQDPFLVARFQRFCGVHGTFSRPVCAGSTTSSSSEADRTYSHNNGACHNHITGENEREHLSVIGAGEGEKVPTATVGARKRVTDSNRGGESENPSQNGEPVSAENAGGETVGPGSNGRSLAGITTVGQGGHSGARSDFSGATESEERETEKEIEGLPPSSTVKPLRKNSLTGDAGQEFLIRNRFLYYMFTFGTELGNELFYITFFPFVTWNMEAFVGRRLIMVWVWVMYLGQCTKDVIGWSRPASPPVVKVEMFYNSEYSMPSTHAMSGTAIPFSLFFLTYGRWEYPFSLGFILALCWCLLVCVSRIYMGMHSVLDVIVGVLYSILILLFFLPFLDLIDGFNLTCRYAPLIIISFHLGLGLFSFNLDTWSTSRGDTAQILGTGAGVALASHVNYYLGLMPDPTPDQLPYIIPALSAGLVGVAVLRLVLGVLVLMATRALMKAITIPLVCWVSGVPSTDVRKARQHMEVELPYRYIVYGVVGFNVLFLVPLLLSYTQLSCLDVQSLAGLKTVK
ncbi:sphingosine-1-phosphate phosphatase 1-like [Cottoperca gobio]|uniref:Sphingosine-1-phosphate phosphatase 1-like n=1 Tax=Cottoperca gobio TaxID=56716 RepID=A0A6J2PC27_COTGO|nr:sphingosine-1-phosphate phosphatase 1-like [Cottoperca gobio]